MEDGEKGPLDQSPVSEPVNCSIGFQRSATIDSFLLDEFLKNMQTCTHTHSCNPPGPDATQHTHTCYHTHTQVFTSEDDDPTKTRQESAGSKSRRPSGNREAVRKYREKKKAHTAYLEEEVKKLRVVNQQLVKRLQGQAMLEAEIVRLRSILMDVRGKIDSEMGVFPIQKPCSSETLKEGECRVESNGAGVGLRCETGMTIPCLHTHVGSSFQVDLDGNRKMSINWDGTRESSTVNCQVDQDVAARQNSDTVDTDLNNLIPQ